MLIAAYGIIVQYIFSYKYLVSDIRNFGSFCSYFEKCSNSILRVIQSLAKAFKNNF